MFKHQNFENQPGWCCPPCLDSLRASHRGHSYPENVQPPAAWQKNIKGFLNKCDVLHMTYSIGSPGLHSSTSKIWMLLAKHLELVLEVDITCSITLGRSWEVVGEQFVARKHPPWFPFPTMWSSRRARQFYLGQETAQMVWLLGLTVWFLE